MPRASTTVSEEEVLEVLEQEETLEEEKEEEPFDVGAIFDLPEVRARMAAVAQEAAKLAVKETLNAMNPAKAPLTLIANVADRFITGSNSPSGSSSPHLMHYRCERLMSDKIVEYDMPRLLSYLEGEKELPTDKEGRPKSARSLCVKQGSWISFLNGHCYAYTENQVQQLEWMKTQPRDKGGLPELYEDAGGAIYRCNLCPGVEPFGSQEGFSRHMYHVHGVVEGAMGVVPPGFQATSRDPFVR